MADYPNRETLTDQAVNYLRMAILRGALEPGALYSSKDLGEKLGMSRTPIREAANELALYGLVAIERNRGIRILETGITDLLEGFELRLLIEVPLTRKAANNYNVRTGTDIDKSWTEFRNAAKTEDIDRTLRADRDFHNSIIRLAGNSRAADVLLQQRNMVLRSGVGTVPTSRSCFECWQDHEQIYLGVTRSDPTLAARAMQNHIVNTAKILIAQEVSTRPQFKNVDADEYFTWLDFLGT